MVAEILWAMSNFNLFAVHEIRRQAQKAAPTVTDCYADNSCALDLARPEFGGET